MSNKKVLLGMSGGVDSSVAALSLIEAGYDVTGVSIRFWSEEDCLKSWRRSCCSYTDVEDARRVADELGMPFYVIDASARFKSEVVDYFLDSYARGTTPNPCVVCNEKVKFALLLSKADELGIDHISTGHYADCSYDIASERYLLKKASYLKKDQSYFLFLLKQDVLSRVLFPLSSLTKQQVREKAKIAGIKTHNKLSSQEVCFLQGEKTAKFLENNLKDRWKQGEIVDKSGKVIGRHDGLYKYTIGQRKGLGLAFGKPVYIVGKDITHNRLMLGDREDLLKTRLSCRGCNWIACLPEAGTEIECQVKIRYSPETAYAKIVVGEFPDKADVFFDDGVYGVATGQAAVFYKEDIVLGGGWIE